LSELKDKMASLDAKSLSGEKIGNVDRFRGVLKEKASRETISSNSAIP
jgi:hypothetical protein